MTGLQTLRDIIQRSWELLGQLQMVDIIDIVIVAYAIYKLLVLTRETRANQVLKGFGVILIAFQISRWLSLTALVWIFEYIINKITVNSTDIYNKAFFIHNPRTYI